MAHSIAEIAKALNAEAFGATDIIVDGASEPASAGPRDLALAMSPAYGEKLAEGQARAAVVWPGADWEALGLVAAIIAPRARLAMARLTQMLDTPWDIEDGIHATAITDGAEIGEGVAIGPYSIVGKGAKIGAGSRIAAHVVIAPGVVIGEGSVILDGAKIMRRVSIGARAVIHPNAVIGSDGFSWVSADVSNVERARATMGEAEASVPDDPSWHRIHSLGGVEIGDDCEIGVGSTIDAGTIRATKIGNGCKIDNGCHLGHNVTMGDHCLMAGHAAVAGSTVIGDRVVLGGQTGVGDNLKIGDDVVTSAGTIVLANVPSGRVMMGYPATTMTQQVDMYKALRRLPRFLRDKVGSSKSGFNSKPE